MLLTLHELTELMYEKQGLRDARIYVDSEEPQSLTFIEEWDTREAVDAYMQSDYFKVLRGGMKILANYWEMELRADGDIVTGKVEQRLEKAWEVSRGNLECGNPRIFH